jgi:hypothetical protein
MTSYHFDKAINSDKLKVEIAAASLPSAAYINSIPGVSCDIFFSSELSSENQATLSSVVASHVAVTTAESLASYLATTIYPFVSKLIAAFAAENMALGITQAGKSDDVLGLFTKKYVVGDAAFPVALKDCFDTGSLYVALQLLAHIRANEDFSGLSPFITDARIVELMNKIETFLGLPLTV